MSFNQALAAGKAGSTTRLSRTIALPWRRALVTLGMMLGLLVRPAAAALPGGASDLMEVREILRTNLPGVSDAEFDRLAIEGVVTGLQGRVWFATAADAAAEKPIADAKVLPGGILHVRVTRVTESLAREFAAVCERIATSNQLKGIALDLRFSAGTDYAAAVAVAELFTREERDLLDWGDGMKKSKPNANALAWPVAVLINGETTGAAEALAAVLRMVGSGLLLGNPTRGAALLPKEFVLADGRRLCVGSIPVRLGDQAKSELGPVTPDISVEVSLATERGYQSDPYRAGGDEGRETGSTGVRTNAVGQRVRISEAELVRAHRESNGVTQQKAPEPGPESPVIADPVLARAVDLLKGLAVFRRTP